MAASNHGHTPAAWTGVTIAFIGFLAGAFFMVKAQPLGVVASLVVVLLGGVVGLVMRAMGLGQPPRRTVVSPAERGTGTRGEQGADAARDAARAGAADSEETAVTAG